MSSQVSTDTTVYIVTDDSGSMGHIRESVQEGIRSLVSRQKDSSFQFRFISFSSDAFFAERIEDLPIQGGSTNIAAAFQLLNRKIVSSPLPGKYIVVFISDGSDDNNSTIVSRLQAQGGMKDLGIPSVFFTVAVGSGFPTKVVVEALRPSYHSASDDLPLVFPLRDSDQSVFVFEKLAEYMFCRDHFQCSLEMNPRIRIEDIPSYVDGVYNSCTVKCSIETDCAKALQHLNAAKALLVQASTRAEELEKELRQEVLPGLSNAGTKPLASRLLTDALKKKINVHTMVQETLKRINQYIEDTQKVRNVLLVCKTPFASSEVLFVCRVSSSPSYQMQRSRKYWPMVIMQGVIC